MRLEIVERPLPSGKVQTTLVNEVTRSYVGQLGPKDSYYNANRIKDATDLYQDLLETGMLQKVLEIVEKRKSEQQK